MVIFSFTFIVFTFWYSWFNIWALGYLGICYLIGGTLFICSLLIFWELYWIWLTGINVEYLNFFWAEIGNNLNIFFTFQLNLFNVALIFVMVSGALFVFCFVFIDMWDDKEGAQFMINLGFFLSFMFLLAISGNLLVFYLGWEGIGFTSLILISFWGERVRSIKATFKVFFINKIGDFFVLILICLLIAVFGDTDFTTINFLTNLFLFKQQTPGSSFCWMSELLGVTLVLGGCVKSAQFGFHIWLLEAMEAPLGASALMHSSTLVVAGLALIFKLQSLIEISGLAQLLMFWLGLFSALFASFVACFQYELKPIMAYSTISNMGYMFILLALGAYKEVILVMILHAYIKIFLFLVVGGVMLHCNGCQDLRWMGGLYLYIPALFTEYIVGGVCLIGLPFWSGYYCKQYILKITLESFNFFYGSEFLLIISYIFTAVYVTRLGYLVFFGNKNGHRRIYRLKPTSLWYIYILYWLGFLILFGGCFWQIFVETSLNHLGVSTFFKDIAFYYTFYLYLLAHGYLLWFLIYIFTGIIFIIWTFFTFNISFYFYLYWNFYYVFFNLIFIYFIVGKMVAILIKQFVYKQYWGIFNVNIHLLSHIWETFFQKLHLIFKYIKIFLREWCYTTNHKKLGLNYMLFAIFSGLFGTTLSTLIRLELAQPGSLIFANNANAYHIVMAIHAIIMVFFLVTPVVFGGFGNYFFPIYVGARDVAYPKLNNFSLWSLPAGLVVVLKTLWEGMRLNFLEFKTTPEFSKINWYKALSDNDIYSIFGINFNYTFQEDYEIMAELNSYLPLYHDFLLTEDLNNQYILPVGGSAVSNYLPTIEAASDLTATMAGWTFTTPFSYSRFTGAPVDWAFAGLVLATFSSILTLINLIVTWRYLKGRGSRYQKEFYPIALIAIFLSLRILLIVSPILNAAMFMLMADRHFYTAFFTVRAGGDILLFQHLFWFFGHPEVYILVMPAFGIASTLIPYYTRKPLGSKMHMVYAMHAIASMGFVVWGHHMYLVGIDNKARILFFVITVMIGLPASIKVCGWVGSMLNSTTFLHVEFIFAVGFVSMFVIGGLSGSFCAHAATDIMLHDTYYIVGHFHMMLSGSLMSMLFAYIYFNLREFAGIYYPTIFALLHCICHVLGHMITFMPMMWLGFAGMPRRIQDYPWGYAGWHSVSSLGHTVVLFSIICFFLALSFAIYLKKPMTLRNQGVPFTSNKVVFLSLNRLYARLSLFKKTLIGLKHVRKYFNSQELLYI